MPDRFLGTQLAQPAAGEAAADCKRQRAPFADRQRQRARHHADGRAGVRARDQSREERTFERQVGGVVVEQEAREDAGRQRNAEAERERHPVGHRAALENQDVAEAAVPDEHRRQRGHHRELDDERCEQHLLDRQLRA